MNANLFKLIDDKDAIPFEFITQNVTIVSDYIADNVEKVTIAPRVYQAVSAPSGVLLYRQHVTEDNDDSAGVVEPGGTFPFAHSIKDDYKTARAFKLGAKFAVTNEYLRVDSTGAVDRHARRVAAGMARKMDNHGIAVLAKTLTGLENDTKNVITSTGWKTAKAVKRSDTSGAAGAGAVLGELDQARVMIQQRNMGYSPDVIVLRHEDAANLRAALGPLAWNDYLNSLGLSIVTTSSTAIAPGEAFVMDSSAVGVMGVTTPVETKTQWVNDNDSQMFWVKMEVAFAITDPLAAVHLKNIGA